MTALFSPIRSAFDSYYPPSSSTASEPASPLSAMRGLRRSSSASSSLAGIEQSNIRLTGYRPISDDAPTTANTASLPMTVDRLRAMSDPAQSKFRLPRVLMTSVRTSVVAPSDDAQSRVKTWLRGDSHEVCPPRASWLHDHFMVHGTVLSRRSASYGSDTRTLSLSQGSLGSDDVFADVPTQGLSDPSVEHVSPASTARSGPSKGSAIVDALRRIFVPVRTTTPIEKLMDELADAQILFSSTERGVCAAELYKEAKAKWHSEGDVSAYSFVKERIDNVRRAPLSIVRSDDLYASTSSLPKAYGVPRPAASPSDSTTRFPARTI